MSQELKTEADGLDGATSVEANAQSSTTDQTSKEADTVVADDQIDVESQDAGADDQADTTGDAVDAIVAEALEANGTLESNVVVDQVAGGSEGTLADIVEDLEEKLAAAVAEKDAAVEKLQYEAAEFQNIRKRQEQRVSDAISRANANLIMRLLPVLDDLELAFANVPESLSVDGDESEEAAWIAGFKQIQKKLLNLLEEEGVTPIDATGEFDPNLHEAILSEPSDEVESGHIIGVLRTGYEFKGQVLRPSMVRVAS